MTPFHISCILSITTGRTIAHNGYRGICEILAHMTEDNHLTDTARVLVRERAAALLTKLYPWAGSEETLERYEVLAKGSLVAVRQKFREEVLRLAAIHGDYLLVPTFAEASATETAEPAPKPVRADRGIKTPLFWHCDCEVGYNLKFRLIVQHQCPYCACNYGPDRDASVDDVLATYPRLSRQALLHMPMDPDDAVRFAWTLDDLLAIFSAADVEETSDLAIPETAVHHALFHDEHSPAYIPIDQRDNAACFGSLRKIRNHFQHGSVQMKSLRYLAASLIRTTFTKDGK